LADIAVNRLTNRVYVSGGTSPGTVTVLDDSVDICLTAFGQGDSLVFEEFSGP